MLLLLMMMMTSTIINQQPAKNSASAMQVRRKFESTTRCRQFAMNHAKDTLATHFRKTMTFDTKYQRK